MADVVITFTIPSAQVARVQNDLCASANLPSTPANARQVVIDLVTNTCLQVEMMETMAAAQATQLPVIGIT